MEEMHKLKEMSKRELEEFSRNDSIASYDLDTLFKLSFLVKNLCEIEMLEDGGYSGNRSMRRGEPRMNSHDGDGNYAYEDSFGDNDGYSQARRGQHYVRGHYSRDDGRDDMVNRLEGLMSRAGSDRDREEIRRMIDQMKGM